MDNAAPEPEKQTFSKKQYNILLLCSKEKDMLEWKRWRFEHGDEKILLAGAYFRGAHLAGADLKKADLAGANLSEANLETAELAEANLTGVNFFRANLRNSTLKFTTMEKANFERAHFEGARFDDVNMKGACFDSAYFENAELVNITVGPSAGAGGKKDFTSFRNARLADAILTLHPECNEELRREAAKALSKGLVNNVQFSDTTFGREVRDESWLNDLKKNIDAEPSAVKRKWKKTWFYIWGVSCNFGRSFWMWLGWAFGIALLFGFLYSIFNHAFNYAGRPYEEVSGFMPFYYSIVTFTTLGFGDITPRPDCWWAQAIVTLEVTFGYIMLGGLISIFANKLARRND
ncbi:MAG: pentapeptide repeat-containing protein [Planctomycetota bacterium]|jgi:hypothetical protein